MTLQIFAVDDDGTVLYVASPDLTAEERAKQLRAAMSTDAAAGYAVAVGDAEE